MGKHSTKISTSTANASGAKAVFHVSDLAFEGEFQDSDGFSTDVQDGDRPQEECGVFGIYAPGLQVARRTFFGIFALQHRGQESCGIAVSDGELSLDEWANLWASPSGLDCAQALNMDGGPSTQLAVSGAKELNVDGGWPVPDVLAFK